MKYDVTFTVHIDAPSVSVLDFLGIHDATPFPTHMTVDGDDVVVVCKGVESEGLMALLEAVRKAQVGLSHALKEMAPGYAGRGLLWGDITSAHVVAAEQT